MRILWDNKVDSAILTASSEATNYPVSNIAHIHLSRRWRSTGDTSEWIKIDAGTGKTITANAVALLAHNLTEPVNLIDRPDCESTTPPMIQGETVPYTTGVTYARSSDFARNGTYSFKMTKTVSGFTDAYASIFDSDLGTDDLHGLVPGRTYHFTQWYYSPSVGGAGANNYRWTFEDYDGGWGNTQGWAGVGAADTWYLADLTFNVRPGATGVRFEMYFLGLAGQNKFIYLDDFDLNAGATVKIQANAADVWTAPSVDETLTYNSGIMFKFFTNSTGYRYWRLLVEDPNNVDGYIEVGRLFLSTYYQVEKSFQKTFTEEKINTDLISYSITRQLHADIGIEFKRYALTFPYWNNTAKQAIEAMVTTIGKHDPIVLFLDEDNTDKLLPIYCHIESDIKFSHIHNYIWQGAVTFREVF